MRAEQQPPLRWGRAFTCMHTFSKAPWHSFKDNGASHYLDPIVVRAGSLPIHRLLSSNTSNPRSLALHRTSSLRSVRARRGQGNLSWLRIIGRLVNLTSSAQEFGLSSSSVTSSSNLRERLAGEQSLQVSLEDHNSCQSAGSACHHGSIKKLFAVVIFFSFSSPTTRTTTASMYT